MKKIFICIGFIVSVLSLKSQVVHQQTYWTRLYIRVKLNDKWSWQIQADNRRFFGENQQLQFIAHSHVQRKLGKYTEGSLGFSFSEVWQGILPVPEWRLFQEFFLHQKLGDKWRLIHRFRTEQRWFHNYAKNVFGTETLASGYNFKFRLRYMPRIEYVITKKWILRANAELMYHLDDFDQYRYYAGVEYKLLKALSIEMGYLKVYQKRSANKGYYDRDNLRLTVFKDFNIKTK